MTTAISINIGLNYVDTSCYPDLEIPQLVACVNDATSMQAIADSLGYVSTLLVNEDATADRIICELGQAAWNLEEGGILLLTYSGHGGQIPDANGDEDDSMDETWVLYDRQLIDDELYNLWNQFASGTRIVVLSDSCHSGSVTRRLEYKGLAETAALKRHYRSAGTEARFKSISQKAAQQDYERHKARYVALQFASGSRKRSEMEASVLLISGCQDNQLSLDGDVNGLFTENLLRVWDDGAFSGSYPGFHKAILAQMPATQTPAYSIVGRKDPDMEAQVPFSVEIPTGGGGGGEVEPEPLPHEERGPQIEGPQAVPRGAPPPVFSVDAGPGRYYAVELAADASLFDTSDPSHQRTDENFYGSWRDTALMQGSTYKLPSRVWDRLRDDERIYYRVLTSSRPDVWEDYTVSNRDTDGEAIPAMQVES